MTTPAADLINHFRAADQPPIDATVETVVDLISSAPPAGKKVLLEAVGKAMIRAEVERQAKKRPRNEAVDKLTTDLDAS